MGQPLSARLWLVRHAAPLLAPGLCYGRLDVPACPQATAASAAALAQALPERISAWHSPLQRCEQLALALQAPRPDLDSKPDARIAEMDFGRWEGQPWSRIARADIDAWTQDFAQHRPGGGECLAQMMARVAAALHSARAHASAHGGDVLWISHAGVARCVQWLLQSPSANALPRADEWPQHAPATGQWVCYTLT